jgi:hypothetical protein
MVRDQGPVKYYFSIQISDVSVIKEHTYAYVCLINSELGRSCPCLNGGD